jgi:hypothetical protein
MGLLGWLKETIEERMQAPLSARDPAPDDVQLQLDELQVRLFQRLLQQTVQEAEDDIARAATKHADVLRRKYDTLTTLDEYGELDARPWEHEVAAYVRRFANFENHLERARDCFVSAVENGVIDQEQADSLFATFITVLPVVAVEVAIGVQKENNSP